MTTNARILVAIVLASALLALTFAPHLSISGDNAEYIHMARDLPAFDSTKYPPVYPALIRLLGPDILVLKLFPGACYVATVAVVAVSAGMLPMLILAPTPCVLVMASQVMADVPFMLLVTVGVLMCLSEGRGRNWWAGFAVLLLSCYVKTAGMAIVLGVLLVSPSYRLRGGLIAAAVLAPWFAWTSYMGGSTYLGQALLANGYYPEQGLVAPLDLLGRVWGNVATYVYHVPLVVALGLLAMTENAWVKRLLFAIAPYVLLVLIWPWAAQRLLVPIVPIISVAVVRSLRGATQGKFLPAVAVVVAVLVIGRVVVASQTLPDELPETWQRYQKAGQWIADHTPEDSIIMARKPGWLAIHAEREHRSFPFVGPDSLWQWIRQEGVDYVVVDELGFAATPRHLIPCLVAYGDSLRVRYSVGGTYVLEVD
jgi:hypothetical protein